jgi:hypothetical protein
MRLPVVPGAPGAMHPSCRVRSGGCLVLLSAGVGCNDFPSARQSPASGIPTSGSRSPVWRSVRAARRVAARSASACIQTRQTASASSQPNRPSGLGYHRWSTQKSTVGQANRGTHRLSRDEPLAVRRSAVDDLLFVPASLAATRRGADPGGDALGHAPARPPLPHQEKTSCPWHPSNSLWRTAGRRVSAGYWRRPTVARGRSADARITLSAFWSISKGPASMRTRT